MKIQNEKKKINFNNKIQKDIYKNLQRDFVIHFNCKKIISKFYLRNNIKYKDFQFRIKPHYKNNSIIIKFRKVKKLK